MDQEPGAYGPVRLRTIGALLVSLGLTGCGGSSVESTGQRSGADLQALARATPIDVTLAQVAETFTVGTDATDVQREELEKRIVGQVVEREVVVYEVSRSEGVYTVISEPVPVAQAGVAAKWGVMAQIRSRSAADEALLQSAKTGDTVRVRGVVKGIWLRTFVTLDPGMVAERLHVESSGSGVR